MALFLLVGLWVPAAIGLALLVGRSAALAERRYQYERRRRRVGASSGLMQ